MDLLQPTAFAGQRWTRTSRRHVRSHPGARQLGRVRFTSAGTDELKVSRPIELPAEGEEAELTSCMILMRFGL